MEEKWRIREAKLMLKNGCLMESEREREVERKHQNSHSHHLMLQPLDLKLNAFSQDSHFEIQATRTVIILLADKMLDIFLFC